MVWNIGLDLQKKITIDKTKVPNTNQTNFPVLISLTGLSNINANGTDIRFTSSDGATELAREIESYSVGTLVAWVKVPTLSTSVNTEIYMYYGNSSATTEPVASSTYGSQNVWDSNFKGVWHSQDASVTTIIDSTSYTNTGTKKSIGNPVEADGKIGKAESYGGNNYVNVADSTSLKTFSGSSSITVSTWVYWNSSTESYNSTVAKEDATTGYTLLLKSNQKMAFYLNGGTTCNMDGLGGVVNFVGWHHIVATYNGSNIITYIDGTLDYNKAVTCNYGISSDSLRFGYSRFGSGRYFNGSLDETRISSTARSADWIKTEYNNQSDPASFYAVATEENVVNSATNGGSEITNYTVTSNPGSFTGTGLTSPIIVSGLTNGTLYTFTVVATNVVGPGPASTASSPVTPAGVPGIPTLLVATPGNALVNLSWTAPANNGAEITNYVIEYKLHTDSSWTQFGHSASPVTSITVVDLVNGSLYDFQVSAYNLAGPGSPSTPAVESTPRTIPGKPIITSVLRGDGQVTVSFSAPDNGGAVITGYTVTSDPQLITQAGATSPIIISGLTNGTPYTFTVKATSVAGDGPVSDASSSVIPAGVPGKATNVSAVAGNTQATVTFTQPISNGGNAITGYTVSSSAGGIDSNAGSTNLSHVITGLTNGTAYTFTVVATNNVGDGLASDPSVEITLPTEPTAVLNLAVVVKSSSVNLTWSEPASTGGSAITDYVIEYKLTTGGDWSIFADGVSVDKLTTVIGLSNNTSYDFRVSAKNIVGQSIASNSVSATPGEPAQVFIQGFPDLTNTSIGTNIRITNEGLIEYEYQYTLCVTDAVDNLCGGGNDVFSASNAKSIASHENFDFIAVLTVPTPGNYFFHIKVLYGSQSSSAYQSFTAVATFPDPPTSVSAVAENAQAVVSFTTPASNGGSVITGYTVTSNPGGLTGVGLTTPITVTGLTNGTTYTFTMTATNIIGTGLSSSPPSNSVTPMTVPGAINLFSASAGNTEVGLFWSAPASDGGSPITDYVIEYKPSSDLIWSIFADAVSTATTVTITGLTNNISYDFRVSTVNSVGQGPVNSTSATSVTPPPVPPVNTGGGSGGNNYVYPVIPATTPPVITPPDIENIAPVIPSQPPIKTSQKTILPIPQNTKPIKNEVRTTPTETAYITPPEKQKEISASNYMWIIIPLILVFFTGFIIFIIRRRRIDDQK